MYVRYASGDKGFRCHSTAPGGLDCPQYARNEWSRMTEFRAEDLLDGLKEPLVYCSADHVIRYMNAAARERYAGRPAAVGRSIFDCHNSASNAQIVEVGERLTAGEDEVQLSQDGGQRSFMRAIRSPEGEYLGYYERYETIGAEA